MTEGRAQMLSDDTLVVVLGALVRRSFLQPVVEQTAERLVGVRTAPASMVRAPEMSFLVF